METLLPSASSSSLHPNGMVKIYVIYSNREKKSINFWFLHNCSSAFLHNTRQMEKKRFLDIFDDALGLLSLMKWFQSEIDSSDHNFIMSKSPLLARVISVNIENHWQWKP